WLFAGVAALCAAALVSLSFLHLHNVGQTSLLSTPSSKTVVSATAAASQPPTFLAFLRSLDTYYKLYLFKSFIGQFGWLGHVIEPVWVEVIRELWTITEVGFLAAIGARLLRLPGSRWVSMRGLLLSAFTALFVVAFILFAEHRFRLLGIIGVIQGRNMLMGL